jgi:hypothetical protein
MDAGIKGLHIQQLMQIQKNQKTISNPIQNINATQNWEKYPTPEDSWYENHRIQWDKAEIVHKEENGTTRDLIHQNDRADYQPTEPRCGLHMVPYAIR